jgi:hypothetical protein
MGARMGVIEAGSKESRARKRSWRGDLRDGADRAISDLTSPFWVDGVPQPWPLPAVPVSLTVVVIRKRPSDQMRSGRFAGLVKPAAIAEQPVQRPDTVKIVRACEDALTGVVWVDDSQIVEHRLYKAYGDQVGFLPTTEGLLVIVAPAGPYAGPVVAVAETALSDDRRAVA